MKKLSVPLQRVLSAALLVVIATGQPFVAAAHPTSERGSITHHAPPHDRGNAAINPLPPMAPGVVLVGLQPGVMDDASDLGALGDSPLGPTLAEIGVQGVEPVFPGRSGLSALDAPADGTVDLKNIHRLHLPLDADILQAVGELEANPAVIYAEPDFLAHLIATPNDPLYSGQQWGLTKIGAPAAWNTTTGSSNVVIAVVDSGMDSSHEDLAAQLWTNPGEIAGNGLDDDSNGYVDDIHGWNILDNNANLTDNTGHGTQVAGVVAAATNNNKGMAGVCWNCRLMVVKVTQPGGISNYSDIATGVAYAAGKGAEVINLSLGGYSDSATLRAAVANASQTAVVVAGAGNDNTSSPFYPAAYNDYVLAVAGTDSSDIKVGTSNYGTWVDVSAPGENITVPFSGGGYGSTSGTSMANAFASGLAALLRSQHADWSGNEARAQIVQTADDIDSLNPGYAGKLGSGRIDAGQAVAASAKPLLVYQGRTVNGTPNGKPEPGDTMDLDITLLNQWADAANVQATLSSGSGYVTISTPTASYGTIGAYQSGTNTTSFRFSVSGSAPYGHNLSFNLRVTADGGYVANIPLTIPISPGITYAHGTLTTDTWTSDRTYIVDNHAGVAAGHVLTIQPGTVVRFDGDYSLSVAGTLIADGTEAQPIRFTSNKGSPAVGDWGQIKFLDSSVDATFDGAGNYTGGSILRHTVIEYGEGVYMDLAAPFIAHSSFEQIDGLGIRGIASAGLVVADNRLTGSDIELCLLAGGGTSVARNTIVAGSLRVNGEGTMSGNNVSESSGYGISVSGALTVTANLVANNSSHGLKVTGGAPTVVSNTLAYNEGAGIYIESGTPVLRNNNLIAGAGQYALHNAATNAIDATGNWWGTTSSSAIQSAIYDGGDQFGLGTVDYSGYLSGPAQDAPAYVQAVTLTPSSPVGIQTVAFDVTFSRPMDQSIDPDAVFYTSRRGTCDQYTSTNSGLPNDQVSAVAADSSGAMWFGTQGGVARFDGSNWTVYNSSNSGSSYNNAVQDIAEGGGGIMWFVGGPVTRFDGSSWTVYDDWPNDPQSGNCIAIAGDGTVWVGTWWAGVARFDGSNWTVYNSSNSGLTSDDIYAVAIGDSGTVWVAQSAGGVARGVARFDGSDWTVYNSSNSGLPANEVQAIAVEADGTTWFGGLGLGIARFDGTTWTTYDQNDTGSMTPGAESIAIDDDGVKWFAGMGSVWRFDDLTWATYSLVDLGCTSQGPVPNMDIDSNGSKWLATSEGVAVLYGGDDYSIIANATWLDDTHWRATYDVTSLVPRDDYTIRVGRAQDTDGMEIAPDTRFGFTVDYAGSISDQTPPYPPSIWASGKEGDASFVEASWSAFDPDSPITLYRYAIGSAAGATDIVDWTTTSDRSMTRTGLGLVKDQQYWVAVQARNVGGLWSTSGVWPFIAGQKSYRKTYMPLIFRN